uniref:65-kDa microtubule-associated protein 3-like n=1 Tax=Tanacetum cinerariifolium TaxID=118510 RepID=A0A699GVE0_TANCI|nr:65-kDa microtubule-associated protein 3-like [Tanacetum cinerariifolium]
MLEEYKILRQEIEEERKRQMDQKKLQGQLIIEQEAMFGSKPSLTKQSGKKEDQMSCGGASNRQLSLGGAMLAPRIDIHSTRATPNTRHIKKNEHQSNNRDDGIGALLAGRRGLDIAGLPANQNIPSVKSNHLNIYFIHRSNKKLSLGGVMLAPRTGLDSTRATPNTRHSKKNERQSNNKDDGSPTSQNSLLQMLHYS